MHKYSTGLTHVITYVYLLKPTALFSVQKWFWDFIAIQYSWLIKLNVKGSILMA